MSKSRKNPDTLLQPPLFAADVSGYPGSGDDDATIRATLTDSIKRCPKKREVIADEMSYLLGRQISEAMLNAYTADSKENHRWPAAWTRTFCQVTGDWRLMQCVAERAGLRLIDARQAKLLELAEHLIEKEVSERTFHAQLQQVLNERHGL